MGAVAKCAPPLRSRSEHEALWESVLRGEVDVIASDHSPCLPAMKQRESFFEVWGGIAGVQWTLPALIEEGCHVRGLEISQIALMTSTNGARRFNLAHRGAIEAGNYADLVLVDLSAAQLVREDALFQRHRLTPYLGRSLRGVVRKTIRRGEVIYSDGTITAQTHGELVKPELKRNVNATSGTHA